MLAVFLLVVRLGASLLPMPMDGLTPATPASALLGADPSAICHAAPAGHAPAGHPGNHDHDHDHDCGLCPICHFLSASALPAGGQAVPAPVVANRVPQPDARPPATGPPHAPRAAARPRAPPVLSA